MLTKEQYNTNCPSAIIHFKRNILSNDCCRVCSDARTVTKSRSESFIMGRRTRYRRVYVTEHVPVAKCCPGYERVGDTCKRELYLETVHSTFHVYNHLMFLLLCSHLHHSLYEWWSLFFTTFLSMYQWMGWN